MEVSAVRSFSNLRASKVVSSLTFLKTTAVSLFSLCEKCLTDSWGSILKFANSMDARDSLGGEKKDLNSFLINSRSVEEYFFVFG